LLFLSGIKNRTGTAYRWYSFLFNKKVKIHRKFNKMHEADYNLKLVEDIIGEKKAKKLYFYLTQEELNSAREYLNKKGIKTDFFIIYPGGSGSAANLSATYYIRLIDIIKEKFVNTGILIASGKNEQEKVLYIYNMIKNKDNVFVMNENLTIRELAAVINHSKVFISGSTGPMHIAAALNIKTLTFFPEKGVTPLRWGPVGNLSEIIIFNNDNIDFNIIIEKLNKLLMENG
jgi:ADP-heptose:LPS heptosyltransferase